MKKIEGFGEIKCKHLNGGRREKDGILRGLGGLVWHNIRHPLGITRKSANFAFAQQPLFGIFSKKFPAFF